MKICPSKASEPDNQIMKSISGLWKNPLAEGGWLSVGQDSNDSESEAVSPSLNGVGLGGAKSADGFSVNRGLLGGNVLADLIKSGFGISAIGSWAGTVLMGVATWEVADWGKFSYCFSTPRLSLVGRD
jgi:hypothetical protein